MKTILECTPRGNTSYEMPDAVYGAINRALSTRFIKSVKEGLGYLPEEIQSLVKATPIPKKTLKDKTPHCIIYDEHEVELTKEEVELLCKTR
jgi:hypothetical protein